jgi:hypothetical protein
LTDVAEFSALLDRKAELEAQIQTEAKEVFAAASKEIFEKYGDKVGVFRWKQYTPYFNDGDECVFSKHDVWIFTPEDAEDEDLRYEEGSEVFYGQNVSKTLYKKKSSDWVRLEREYEAFENPDFDPEYGEPYTAIHDLCKLIDEDTAKALFGDHVEVIVTKDGVEVEEYSHD